MRVTRVWVKFASKLESTHKTYNSGRDLAPGLAQKLPWQSSPHIRHHLLISSFLVYASLANISSLDSGKMQIGVMHLSRQEHLREIWDGCCLYRRYIFSWLAQMSKSQDQSINGFSDRLFFMPCDKLYRLDFIPLMMRIIFALEWHTLPSVPWLCLI